MFCASPGFCISLSSVCCLLICLLLALSFVSSSPSWLSSLWACLYCCVRGGERFLQCQQVDQDKGVPSSTQSQSHSHYHPHSQSHSQSPVVGGNRLLQMPETLRAKQIVTYKLCSEQTKPSNHPMNDWQALATIMRTWPQNAPTPTAMAIRPKSQRATTTTTTRSNKWFNNKLPPGSGSPPGFVSASRYLGICQVQA